MRRIALIGTTGQLGRALVARLPTDRLVPLRRAHLDVCDPASVRARLDALRPAVVVNASAYNRVDACETDANGAMEALRTNALGAAHLARWCAANAALLVHFSTDYVFDGRRRTPYPETAPLAPLSMYGTSKAAGELLVRALAPRHLIIRTSGLYGPGGSRSKGTNFVDTMLQLAREGRTIRVVGDQVLTPTYAADLAAATAELLERTERGGTARLGTYHLTNAGQCSWYEFARAIFRLTGLKPECRRTTKRAYGAPARRPPYSVLANRRARALGVPPLRHWSEALAAYLRRKSEGYRPPP